MHSSLLGEAAKSHCKGHRYRERKNWAIIAISGK
jgi:hypothetical protein